MESVSCDHPIAQYTFTFQEEMASLGATSLENQTEEVARRSVYRAHKGLGAKGSFFDVGPTDEGLCVFEILNTMQYFRGHTNRNCA